MVASQLTGIPWSCTAHRGDIVMANDLPRKVASATFVRCISETSRQLLIAELVNGAPDVKKVVVGHLGVDLVATESRIDDDSITLVCPAQFKEVKGHRYLIEAAAILRERSIPFRLLLCGEGPEEEAIASLVERHRLGGSVVFAGQLSQVELFSLYSSGTVRSVVLPSLDLGNNLHEGIPVSLMEAMSHGVPVVSTTTGGIVELIANETTGMLVPPADATALADALARLLSDVALARRIGGAGRNSIEANWSSEYSAAELLKLIDQGPQ